MEAGSLTIFLYALFLFSAEGAPKFAEKCKKPYIAVEGANVTLEWRYTFGEKESFRRATFAMGSIDIAEKSAGESAPFIILSYRDRLHVTVTNNYTSITLMGVNRLDTGSYALKVITYPDGAQGASTSEITVLYLDQPNITLTDNRPVEGSDVTLSCTADGQPTPAISWTMNGSPLNTSGNSRISFTDDDLTIANVNRTDSGEYQCVAENRLRNISSSASTLSVQYQPEITLNPLNVTKAEGENVTLTCNATGNPEPNISWIVKWSSINMNYCHGTDFSKDRQKMTIMNVSRTDSGEYQCMATNNLGNDSSQVATLDVLYKPEISPLPQMIQRTEGGKMILFCKATGNPVPTISWTINGFSLDSSNISRMNLSYEGKQLTITNVNRTDSALYRCMAKNSLGSVVSHGTTLEVHYIPGVTMIGGPQQFAIVGKVKKLICEYDAVPSVSEVQWIKDGGVIAKNFSLLVNESRLTVSFYSESQIQLLINQSTSQDAGNYSCLVINAVGNSSQKTSVISQELPLITIHPEGKTPMEGENITLSCNATGNPEPSIYWVKDGFPINSNFRITFSQDNKRLRITNISRTDSGEYQCMARNRVGNDTSNSKVNVLFKPEVTIDSDQEQYVAKGSNIRLICRYDASPPASEVQWIKDGTVISGNTSKLINDSRVAIPFFNESQIQFSISVASLKDGGNYTCRVTNILNSTQDTTLITIEDKPEIATHPHSITIEEGQKVTLYCNSTGNPVPTISWNKDGYPVSNGFRIILSPSHEQLTIRNVNRIDRGDYKCLATNRVGTDTSNASTINVLFRAEIVSHPQANITKEEGSNLTLFCNATGNPAPIILWTKDGSPINNTSRINFSIHNRLLNIPKVNRKDRGHYRCVANNSLGNDTSNVAAVDIQYKPEITTRPENRDIEEGGNVTFSCNSTANPLPTTLWTKDESPVTNNSRISFSVVNKILTITNVNRNDSGEYRCVSSNKLGNDTSKPAELNVKYRPEITEHPQNVTETERNNVTFTCNATGNPEPQFSWFKEKDLVESTNRIYLSANNSLLTITDVNRNDSGEYRCVARNEVGNDTSKTVVLDVQYRPEIASQPQKDTTTEGKNVTLTCNATGNPEPALSWFKDENLVNSSNRISFSADNRLLTITNVRKTDRGKYLCFAYNEVGNASSKTAILNVQYEPEIITNPSSDTMKEGQNRTFYCNATGNPLPAISWKKDGHSIGNNSRISYSAEGNELTIINVYRTDSGNYRCVANNSIGNASSVAAALVVEYKSKITTDPSNVTKTEGENVTLHCNATGYPLPTLSWTKAGSDISNNPRISFSADKKQLAITKASRVDNGTYRCVANNSLGNDTSMAAVVDVQFAPEISMHPRNVTIVRGDNVTFSCSVVGNPTPSVVWRKDGRDLNVTANSRFHLSSRNKTHSLEIAEVHRSDSGQYRCKAKNSKNISYSSAATLTVQYVPNPPKDVEVITRGSREVNISWTAGFDGKSAIQNYTVEIGRDKQTFRDVICQGTLSKNSCVIYSTRVSIKALLPWTTYYLRVFATNMIGSSNRSSVVNVTTDEEVPSSAPPFNVTVLSSTAVNVSWQMLTKEEARGAILGYYILYKRKSEPETSWKNRTVDGAENTSLVLASLDEYTSYQFVIQAFNHKGVSGRSEIVEKRTDEAVPRSAPTLHVTVLNSTAVNVSWQMLTGQDARGVIQGYYILYKRVSDLQLDWENDTINRAQTTYLVVASLEKYTQYQFSIQAFNRKGVGVQSNVTEMRTDEDVPSEAPEGITAAAKSSTSIKLEWKPVPERDLNGIFTKYFITYSDGKKRKVSSSSPKVVINGLRASTTYSFHISAATAKGEGPQSKPTEATTDDPPTPPDPDYVGTNEVSVAFKPWKILSNGDEVSCYQIIVVPLEEGKDPGKPSDKKYVHVIKRYEDKSEGEPYITAEFSNNNEQRKTFPVGDGKYYSRGSHVVARRKRREVYTKYFNGKLDADTEYAVFQRSHSENGYYQDEGFSRFTTKTLPREEEPTPGKKNKHLIVVGVFIGLFIVCVVVVGGIVIVWLRGRRQNNANDDGEEISLEEQGYENFDPEGEIAVEEFEDHVKRLQEDDLFSVEYGAIRSQGNVTSKATLAEENKHKNRYNNIVAYDHSRVKLTPIEGVRGSDYINANFLDGYQKDKAYIATQGPLEHTSDDFWRMVWEQGTKTIVMVTNLEEKGRLKCHQYWPSEGAESYGDIRVTLMQTVQLTEFTIRTMTLKHANNSEQRTVNQYHYTVWPDHGVPECPSSLLTFVRKASRANPPDAGPMVVHCSAGVGRTGTFIVVDAMLRRIAAEKTVDVYEYVTSLRQDRNFMVQVEEQYILIHDVLVEAIHSGFTEIHANDLRSHIKNLMQVNQTSGQSEMDEEFIRLGRCINTSQLTAQAASMACNVTKNRYPNALPYDETRVKLSVISGVEGSDYINANFIDGYMTRRAFIATQAPIPDTIPDFWRMIWEQESSTIVVLSKETEGDKVKVHQYWPAEKPAHIGTLVVEKTSETSYEDYTMREMKLTHTKESASRVVRQYHYTGWPDSGSPESGTGLIDLIGQVQRWQQQSENTKITVHCSAGVGRTGVFCALSILIGQLKSEGVVDVFQTVKQLRVERPAMVQTKGQYEFIYSALSEYLDSFDAYSNF